MTDTAWLVVEIAAAFALLGVVGSLIVTWMRSVERDMDVSMRAAGHVPPEVDAERTALMVPVIADPDLQHGTHSLRAVGHRTGGIRLVRTQEGLVQFIRTVSDEAEYEGRHHLSEALA